MEMDREKVVKQLTHHILDTNELTDKNVDLINAALVGLKWSQETYDFTITRLEEILANNNSEIPDWNQ